MARDEALRHTAKCQLNRFDHSTFGAADISQHGVAQLQRCQFGQDRFHRQHRHRQQNNVSALHRLRQAGRHAVHHAEGQRLLARDWIGITTYDLAAHTRFADAFGKGTTNQAKTDHRQASDCRARRGQRFYITHSPAPAASASTWPSTSRKRWFSSGKPMDTRKWLGIP